MRRKGLWLSVLATALIAGNVSAATIEGNLANGLNWGNYGGNFNSAEWRHDLISLVPNSGYRSVAGVWDGDPGAPGGDPDGAGPRTSSTSDVNWPAAGGQNYDAEELFYYYQDTLSGGYLHIALVTGFNPSGEASGVGAYPTFRAGDLFVDLGADGGNDIAVAMSNNETRSGSAWANTGLVWPEYSVYYDADPATQPDHREADPFRLNEGAPFPANHLYYDQANPDLVPFDGQDISSDLEIAWTQLDTNGNPNNQRWLYEIRLFLDPTYFDETLILDDQNGGIGLHWTMECGNDYVGVMDDTPFAPVPVPAAAPMGLLGMGLLALVRRVRRRTEC